jgi:hydroxymethylpyrimidine kinase/phosphomethylpyrimidine kinase
VNKKSEPTRILTVGGSDSGGAAGIQADLKTFTVLGTFGMSVITAVTAQNSVDVIEVFPLPSDFVADQLDAVLSDYGAQGVKSGFLGRTSVIKVVASKFVEYDVPNVVIDPVLVNHTGQPMFSEKVSQAYVDNLFPIAGVITPNVHEAGMLAGIQISNVPSMTSAAIDLFSLGARRVVVTGGRDGAEAVDVFYDGRTTTEFRTPWVETANLHGSGDTFSSALCTMISRGIDLPDAIDSARRFTLKAIQGGKEWRLGAGHGPVSCWGLDYPQ